MWRRSFRSSSWAWRSQWSLQRGAWPSRRCSGRQGLYYSLVLLLLAGLTGMVVTADLFNLFVFLEISSLAGYALVFLGGRKGMLAGYRYLILGTLGGAFYLLGVAFLYFATGYAEHGGHAGDTVGL